MIDKLIIKRVFRLNFFQFFTHFRVIFTYLGTEFTSEFTMLQQSLLKTKTKSISIAECIWNESGN